MTDDWMGPVQADRIAQKLSVVLDEVKHWQDAHPDAGDYLLNCLARYVEQATDTAHDMYELRRASVEDQESEAAAELAALRGLFSRRWVCRVVSTGYHSGAGCNPDDPHDGDWRCGYYWAASVMTDKEARHMGLPVVDKEEKENDEAK